MGDLSVSTVARTTTTHLLQHVTSAASRAIPTSTAFSNLYVNHTDPESGVHLNRTGDESDLPLFEDDTGLSTTVTVAIATGSAIFVIIIIIVTVCFVHKRYHKRKTKGWVDNLTLSYIADSNIDLTKDSYDEMISLDNDNFLNSLDSHSFSVFSPDSTTRQYTYSYF